MALKLLKEEVPEISILDNSVELASQAGFPEAHTLVSQRQSRATGDLR